MIDAAEGPWGESRDQGLSLLSFGGYKGLLGPRGGDCGDFFSCGRTLHGSKVDCFTSRTLLIMFSLMLQGGGVGGVAAE